MSQKVNPIAVRLRFNRRSNSSWFSDYYYSTLLYQDLNFREYLSSIKQPNSNKIGFRPAKCVIHHFPKRSIIHLFCLARRKATLAQSSQLKYNSIINRSSTITKSSHGFLINIKKKALASYIRQSYNSSRLLLNQLGDADSGIRTDAVLRKVAGGDLKFDFSPSNLNKASFIVNLVELQKAFTASRLLKQPVYSTKSVADLSGINLDKEIKHSLQKSKSKHEVTVACSQLPAEQGLHSINLLLIGSGITEAALRFQQNDAQRLEVQLQTGFNSTANMGSELADQRLLDMGKKRSYNPLIKVAKQEPTTDLESLIKPNTSTSKAADVLKQRSLETQLFFDYFSMRYFFLKKTNSISDNILYPGQVHRLLSFYCKQPGFVPLTKNRNFYLSNIQSILSEKTSTYTSLRPIKVSSIFQSAYLVAQEIACKLEQKKSFRQICRSIFQQISNCNYIKGIRISCSGRLNGAEIAKTECRKYGETSLHVFSDKIDYAQTKCCAPYGILGVKVWISYV